MADITATFFPSVGNYSNEFPYTDSFTPSAGETLLVLQACSCSTPSGLTFNAPIWDTGGSGEGSFVLLGGTQNIYPGAARCRWYWVSSIVNSNSKSITGNWPGGGSYFGHQIHVWRLTNNNTSTQTGALNAIEGSGTRTLSLTTNTNTSAVFCVDTSDSAPTTFTIDGSSTGCTFNAPTPGMFVFGWKLNVGNTATLTLGFDGTTGSYGMGAIEILNASPAAGTTTKTLMTLGAG